MKSILLKMTKCILLVSLALNVKPAISQNSVIDPELKTVKRNKQTAYIGFGAEAYMNGDAHGTFYSAGITLERGNSILCIAPCMQKRSLEVNGGKISFSYLLSGINECYDNDRSESKNGLHDVVELRVLCNLQYTHKAQLSYCASRVETITTPENAINFNEVRFSTISATLGPEMDLYLKKIKIRTYAGASFFHHFKYNASMYRPGMGTALVFGIGVYIPHL